VEALGLLDWESCLAPVNFAARIAPADTRRAHPLPAEALAVGESVRTAEVVEEQARTAGEEEEWARIAAAEVHTAAAAETPAAE